MVYCLALNACLCTISQLQALLRRLGRFHTTILLTMNFWLNLAKLFFYEEASKKEAIYFFITIDQLPVTNFLLYGIKINAILFLM